MPAATQLAIVGLGRWGKVLVDSVQNKSETVRFVAAVSRDPARIAADAAERGLTTYDNLDAALADPAVEGIVLASPHSLHAEQIATCVAAGKPVLVEKPFTLTRATAAEALGKAADAGVLVTSAHNRRFLTPITRLKAMLDAGELGTLLHLETNFSSNVVGRYSADHWRVAPGESPAGGLAGSGIHHIDGIIFLAGPISEVFAVSCQRVHEVPLDDTTVVTMRLASGATASLLMITATTPTFRIVAYGTKGKAEINGDAAKRGTETMVVTALDGTETRHEFEAFDIERAEVEAFAASIRDGAPAQVPAADILNGIAAFEAVPRSAETGQPIKL
ncbi:gfo/Idh/MocA family oxidoreductase [Acuticoccus sediminis]|uniref:Gfo/Idh/MocA family oxidoreductase n=1 Tax=Acuticoccus sediminis TaxID=2184697 RepID=A0A8B2NRV7_9HYPH|nr:Gfo/Idh/MocA family oxidoreductase [Acuticoccus sediminis]RAI00093.1 gfo/Idh/MocA family oxidoreductase [Acuticoccus sediminis]